MAYNEMHGALNSRYAEEGIVAGCNVARSGAGVVTVAPGVVRMKKALGTMHSLSINLQIGNATMAAGVAAPTVAALADGFYFLYAHPKVDADGIVDDYELRYGGLIQEADGSAADNMAEALEGTDPADGATANVQVGSEIATVPEPNYDASAFKMGAQIPDSDFYKGRSVKLACVQVDTSDVVAVNITCAKRV